MRSTQPPIRALLPGRCFRYEAIDASHGSEFFQVEGLMVDEGTTMGDLAACSTSSPRRCSAPDKRTRFRPGYYPFTEPSVAFDVECLVCGGVGLPGLLADRLDDDPGRRAWSTRSCSSTAASTPSATRASRSGWAPSGSRSCATASATCALFLENDLRFLEQFR